MSDLDSSLTLLEATRHADDERARESIEICCVQRGLLWRPCRHCQGCICLEARPDSRPTFRSRSQFWSPVKHFGLSFGLSVGLNLGLKINISVSVLILVSVSVSVPRPIRQMASRQNGPEMLILKFLYQLHSLL